ncbi:hypothetical protein V5O48_019683, partial [Marasmius crinis-equi]
MHPIISEVHQTHIRRDFSNDPNPTILIYFVSNIEGEKLSKREGKHPDKRVFGGMELLTNLVRHDSDRLNRGFLKEFHDKTMTEGLSAKAK